MAEKEYIEREAAINVALMDDIDKDFPRMDIAARLHDIPAADVRPAVRGKWMLGGYGKISDATEKWYDKYLQGGFLYCSVCKGRTSIKFNFCPNCGADMREES